MSQCQKVLDILIDEPGITQLIAGNYGIRRLASRITDLKAQDIDVQAEMRTDAAGVRYAFYYLPFQVRLAEKMRRDSEGLSWRQVA